MEYEKIEQRVIDLLEISAVEREGKEHSLWLALYHMLMAVSVMDMMNDEEKTQVVKMKKHFDYFFSTKFSIKKRSRKEKKKPSPHTPYKDKAEKEREIEGESFGEGVLDFSNGDMAVRKKAFWAELLKREAIYGREMLQDFFDHWGEESRTKGVLLFEKRTHWNLDSRLRKWSRDSQTLANARLEAQIEQSKAGAVTADEQIARNPDGILARLRREREAKENAKKTTD